MSGVHAGGEPQNGRKRKREPPQFRGEMKLQEKSGTMLPNEKRDRGEPIRKLGTEKEDSASSSQYQPTIPEEATKLLNSEDQAAEIARNKYINTQLNNLNAIWAVLPCCQACGSSGITRVQCDECHGESSLWNRCFQCHGTESIQLHSAGRGDDDDMEQFGSSRSSRSSRSSHSQQSGQFSIEDEWPVEGIERKSKMRRMNSGQAAENVADLESLVIGCIACGITVAERDEFKCPNCKTKQYAPCKSCVRGDYWCMVGDWAGLVGKVVCSV